MTLSGKSNRGKHRAFKAQKSTRPHVRRAPAVLREFAYLDQVSVQSLLVSLIGNLPSEVTSLSSRSSESEVGGTIGADVPLIGKAGLSSRFKGGTSDSSQVLSRAVSESLFKHLYELVADQLVWSSMAEDGGSAINLDRGSLIEVTINLASDPIYRFNSTMGVLGDLAEDYPALLEDETMAMILAEAGPINKVLERLMVGLIPLKAEAVGLFAADVDGEIKVGAEAFFRESDVTPRPLTIVGVTEQQKYWRDVRRVLFSQSSFTLLGRISRTGVQESWTPVKLTEVMRDIAPQFPDAITRAGMVDYAAPTNTRQEENRQALERALLHFALCAGGAEAESRRQEIVQFAELHRSGADDLRRQHEAFRLLVAWLVEQGIIASQPSNERELISSARRVSGLRAQVGAASLADFSSPSPVVQEAPEHLLDLEVIAIYW